MFNIDNINANSSSVMQLAESVREACYIVRDQIIEILGDEFMVTGIHSGPSGVIVSHSNACTLIPFGVSVYSGVGGMHFNVFARYLMDFYDLRAATRELCEGWDGCARENLKSWFVGGNGVADDSDSFSLRKSRALSVKCGGLSAIIGGILDLVRSAHVRQTGTPGDIAIPGYTSRLCVANLAKSLVEDLKCLLWKCMCVILHDYSISMTLFRNVHTALRTCEFLELSMKIRLPFIDAAGKCGSELFGEFLLRNIMCDDLDCRGSDTETSLILIEYLSTPANVLFACRLLKVYGNHQAVINILSDNPTLSVKQPDDYNLVLGTSYISTFQPSQAIATFERCDSKYHDEIVHILISHGSLSQVDLFVSKSSSLHTLQTAFDAMLKIKCPRSSIKMLAFFPPDLYQKTI